MWSRRWDKRSAEVSEIRGPTSKLTHFLFCWKKNTRKIQLQALRVGYHAVSTALPSRKEPGHYIAGFILAMHTSMQGQHLKIIFSIPCSGSSFAVSFLCQSAVFLSRQPSALLNEGQIFQWKMLFFIGGKKQEGDVIVLITCRQIHCNFYLFLSRRWWKVWFAHRGLVEEIELVCGRGMRNWMNKDPHSLQLDWYPEEMSLLAQDGLPSPKLPKPHKGCAPRIVQGCWRRWSRFFSGTGSEVPFSF